ncbi:MAG: DUF2203 domain-containing protein [Planctomycetota bacterium]|nr:DUF2203 domain-containing protein [Planctomycetota bacterium]MDA1213609.1 DUF2203 domain-containing protein [Planctomycetota bacterium]
MSVPAERKYYTVETANRALPLVKGIVGDIVALYHDIHERKERLNRIRQLPGQRSQNSAYSEELEQIEEELEKDISRLEDFVGELTQIGVELKDPVKGLVDFYSKMDGRDVYLCWMMGETEVSHWHELEAGFSGRQSLLEGSFPKSDDKT